MESTRFEENGGCSDIFVLSNTDADESENENEDIQDARRHKQKSEVMKKRKSVNKEKWERNIKKSKKAKGEEYVNTRGQVVKARITGNDCNCKYRCFENIDEENRCRILNNFNSIGIKKEQDEYLCRLIACNEVKRKRNKDGTGKSRNVSNTYNIRIGTSKEKVCKKAFCAIHGISRKRVEIIASHIRITKTVSAPPDRRGKHHNHPNAISKEIIDQIDAHIKKFPRQSSHYSTNKNLQRYYLSPDLNVKKLHKLYLQEYEPIAYANLQSTQEESKNSVLKPVVRYDFFNRYFKSRYSHYSFGQPRSDTCLTGDKLDNGLPNKDLESETRMLMTEKGLHLNKARAFYDMKSKQASAKVDSAVETLAIDFQQNAPLPNVTAADEFFLRQLWMLNFLISKNGEGLFLNVQRNTERENTK